MSSPNLPQRRHQRQGRQRRQIICGSISVVILWIWTQWQIFVVTVEDHGRNVDETKKNHWMTSSHQPQRLPPLVLKYQQESAEELLRQLPQWIQDYVQWHAEMRRQFPGMQLFDNPKAPPILLRTCLGICGGLHDRLGQLPWDLYLANQTRRVLLLAWQRPQPLESFLMPNTMLNWSVPYEFRTGFHDMHRVRNFTQLFQGMPEDHPTEEFFTTQVDQALERATHGEFVHIKVLRHRILGHLGEPYLQKRLDKVAVGDNGIHATTTNIHAAPHFGRIFWLFFRPSPPVEAWTRQILEAVSNPLHFTAVHCRVRHPKATAGGGRLGKNPKYPADKTGLPWEGETRQFALEVATQALQCTPLDHPVYFLSDSNDLVKHVVEELSDPLYQVQNQSEIYAPLLDWTKTRHQHNNNIVFARNVDNETTHLDRQKGRPAEAYYATFCDLLVVAQATCVVYGVGYYAAFGAKISGVDCQYCYTQEAWGRQTSKEEHARKCPETTTTATITAGDGDSASTDVTT